MFEFQEHSDSAEYWFLAVMNVNTTIKQNIFL
jgi:hypothetical protein